MKNNKNAWLVRGISNTVNRNKDFITGGIVALEINNIGNLSGKNISSIREQLSKDETTREPRELTSSITALNRLVNDMSIGDYVVLLSDDDVQFGIIKSDYIYNKKADINGGYPHQRKVNWQKTIRRDDLSIELKKAVRSPFPIVNLSSYVDIIKPALEDNLDNLDKQDKVIEQINKPVPVEVDDKTIITKYQLRLNKEISIGVPTDMTKEEAHRLGEFIKTLYFN